MNDLILPGTATASDTAWPPPLPPRAEPTAIPVDDWPGEDELAGAFLFDLAGDFRYATDLGRWIMRDGYRWVPARRADVAGYIAACAQRTPAAQPAVQDWVRHGCPKGVLTLPDDYGGTSRFTHADAAAYRVAGELRRPAAQQRVAVLMERLAPFGSGGSDCLTVDTRELDAEPGVLWAGGVPFDLAASLDGPAVATDNGRPWELDYPHMHGAPYCPDPRVPVPLWDELTAAVFPDPREREHALDALSHGLHGWPSEAAILARAATGTGKSYISSLMTDLLGSYAGQVSAATLFGRSGNAQFAFDEMGGARFVVVDEGHKADFRGTETFKAVINPGPVANARARHEQHRRLIPARHTVFVTINPDADLRYSDPAVVRRLIPAGFTGRPAKIAEIAAKYGTATAEGRRRWEAEAPGVLARMITRCARVLSDPVWYGTRASAPESVMARFAAVVAEANPFGRWLAERCCDGMPTATETLLDDHEAWCRANHETPLSPVWFGRALASAGIDSARVHGGRGWKIALRP